MKFIKRHKFGILKLACMIFVWLIIWPFKKILGVAATDTAWAGYSFLIIGFSGLAGMFDVWSDGE